MPTAEELIELQKTLYASGNPTRRWLHNSRKNWIIKQICKYSNVNYRALEVGPGAGIYLPELAARAGLVYVSDNEAVYLEHARILAKTFANLRCVTDDITCTHLPAGHFDLILCTEVVEHIADSQAALCGLLSLLAPGGRLILSTPQRFSPLEVCAKIAFLPGMIQLVRWIYQEPVVATGHINLLTEGLLKKQLHKAGFHIETQFKTGFYLPLIAEFGGRGGQRLLAWIEGKLRGSRFSWLLWTQCYVLCRAT